MKVVRPVGFARRLKGRLLDRLAVSVATRATPEIASRLMVEPRVFGPDWRLHVAPTATVNDALFNLNSGEVHIGDWVILAHGVTILTGVHDVSKFGRERQVTVPAEGRDVRIDEGAWLASNVTVIGPCTIGAHAVVAAGSVVRDDVPAYAMVAGVPAKVVGQVPH